MESTPEFEERRKQTIWERLDEVSQEFRLAHKGHRTRLEQVEHHLDALDADTKTLAGSVTALAAAPVEATKLRFSPQVLVVVCGAVITLVGGAYGISNRVLGRIDAFEERLDRQAAADKDERASQARLQEERYLRSEKQFDAFGRQMELFKYEQQRLREDVTTKKGSSR